MLARDIVKFRDDIVPQLTQKVTLARARLPRLNWRLPQWQFPSQAAGRGVAPSNESSELYWEAKSWALQWDGYALFGDQTYDKKDC
jgi:hypothetical protein